MNITAWTLIVILHGQTVTHTDGFASLSTCREARQLVLTGRTVASEAEYQKAEAKRQEAQRIAAAKYAKEHPCKPGAVFICGEAGFTTGSWITPGYAPTIAECVPELPDSRSHADAP